MSVEYESRKIIDSLRESAEATTGESYTNLTEAHQALKNGYGQGAKEEMTKTVYLTESGFYSVYPDEGKVLSSVDVAVVVKCEEVKDEVETTLDITENGTTELVPEEGETFSKVTVNVDVPTSGGNVVLEKPYLDTTLITSLYGFCASDVNLGALPFIDSSNVVDYPSMFNSSSIKTQPDLNYKKGTTFISMFDGSSIEAINMEIDDPVYFNYFCRNCTKLKTVNLTVQNAITLAASFSGCTGLTEVNLNGTPNVATFNQTFLNCKALKTIMGLDMSVMTTNVSTFQGCSALENISVNHINIANNNFILADSKLLTVDSLVGILNALSDNTSLSKIYTVQLGSENLAKLSIEQKLIAENKNIELI
jgi:hypothetical protein